MPLAGSFLLLFSNENGLNEAIEAAALNACPQAADDHSLASTSIFA
jgi:hypothetical protein